MPTFYDGRDGDGPPARWLQMVRSSLATIGPRFGATRMVSDYVERVYPSH